MNKLQDWVFEEFIQNGTDLSFADAREEMVNENPDADEDKIDELMESVEIEEANYELEMDGMKLQISWLGGAPMVWVFESPHTTYVRLCSPCVPNAGDLDSQDPNGFECYTLPAEWFGTE